MLRTIRPISLLMSVWTCSAALAQGTKPPDPPVAEQPKRPTEKLPADGGEAETLSKKLDRTDGVLTPPNPNADAEIRVQPPADAGTIRVIPPPTANPDGQPIKPK